MKAVPGGAKRLRALLALTSIVCIASISTAGAAGRFDPDPVGRALTLDDRGPMMQSVNAPARIARVAVVPGSGGGEAWGIGYSFARRPGWDTITPAGQAVFVRYTAATGWRVYGPPLGSDGRPMNQPLTSIAVTSRGEGWATGTEGALYHRRPGGDWKLDPASFRVTRNTLYSISIREDRAGVYGFASGANLTFLRLTGSDWELDSTQGTVPVPGNTVPDMVSVTAVSRDVAWAVSGSNSNALVLFHRTSGAWTRRLTQRPMFDSPPAPSARGDTLNQYARGSAIASNGSTVWITGMMQPVDPTRPTGDTSAADKSRSFAIRVGADGSRFETFCPPLYQFSSTGVSSTVEVCDKRFPFSTGELPALSVVGGETFAGGLGFFRFRDGAWARIPNVAGPVLSASFASPDEGWVTSSGDVIGNTGVAVTSSMTLGHWTARPASPALRRWPQPNRNTLHAVALEPGGVRAMAVGARGSIMRLDPAAGWERMDTPTDSSLHGLAWVARNEAWAVGSNGTIIRFDGARWLGDPGSRPRTDRRLYAVAFRSADEGFAVGEFGTILRYRHGIWTVDPSSGAATERKLVAIAAVGQEYVAVGDKGTILVRKHGRWVIFDDLEDTLRSGQEGQPPNLLSIASLPDGTALIGGARGVMLERTPSGAFTVSSLPPLDGSIHSIALRGTRDALQIYAAVGSQPSRYSGDLPGNGQGWLFSGTRDGWRDVSLAHAVTTSPEFDAPVLRDAVYGLAIERDGRGWAVGGFPSDTFDDDGHLRSTPTSSIWRVDEDGDPEASPGETGAELPVSLGVSFAFIGDTACASGLCAAALGSGTRADVVAASAMKSIARAANEGKALLLVFGGDMRRNGLPDELEPFRSLLDDLPIPTFATVGDKDLFAGLGGNVGDQHGGVLGSNGYFRETFGSSPAPWGVGRAPHGVRPVPDETRPVEGARTHYALDLGGAAGTVRIIVLDTSRTPLASNIENQNPPEDQSAWLQTVLLDARARGVPSIVVMHQPVVLPVGSDADAASITGILTANGASAVVAAHQRLNRTLLSPSDSAPDPIPVGIFGGGGSPLQAKYTPERGAYHAWQLVTIDPDPAARTITGRAPVTFRSIPVLESLALDALDGRDTSAGHAIRFEALGRLPDVGGAHGLGRFADQDEGRATYLRLPFPRACGLLDDPERVRCTPATVATPEFFLRSDDPSIAEFVRAHPSDPSKPFRDTRGRLVRDPQSSLLCTFKPGRATVRVESGYVGAVMPVVVGGGSGPCVPAVFADGVVAPGARGSGPSSEAVRPEIGDDVPPTLFKGKVPGAAAIGAVAPPIVNAAPAPPAGGSGQREEQKQAASERADFTALKRQPDTSGVLLVGVLIALAFTLATVARPHARITPAVVYATRRRST